MNEEIQGTVDSVMNTDVMGTPLRDLLTFEFLAGIAGSILGAIAILIIGFWLAGMVQKRVRRIGDVEGEARLLRAKRLQRGELAVEQARRHEMARPPAHRFKGAFFRALNT